MKRFVTALLVGCTLLSGSAKAQSEMSVAGFLMRADRAQSLGRVASLTSPDYLILRGEVTRVARIFNAEVASAKSSGRPPPACMPPRPDLTPDDLLAFMRRIPPNARPRISVKTAIYAMLRQRYPCSAR